jgi:hypothetical protein
VRSAAWPLSDVTLRRAGSRIQRPVGPRRPLRACRVLACLALRQPPQDAADPRHQLARLERFGQIVVGTDLETDDPVGGLVVSAQDDDPDVGQDSQLAGERKPVDPRQADVEDGKAHVFCGDEFRAALAVGHGGNPKAGVLEAVRNQGADGGIVLDDQDMRWRRHANLGRARPPKPPDIFGNAAATTPTLAGNL